jgi:glutathione S-transferase
MADASRHVVLSHAIPSRSAGVRMLLEELGADYELQVLNLKAGDQLKPEYLAVNPMGKVPAVLHNGALVTEQVAVYLYLADLYPEAGLAPPIGDALRGPYLRWMAFYGSCYEPAVIDRAMKRDAPPRAMSPYADFDTVFGAVTAQLERGPWMLGERFTAVDVLWGSALTWTSAFKLLPEHPAVQRYIERFNARPAVRRARAADEALAKELAG